MEPAPGEKDPARAGDREDANAAPRVKIRNQPPERVLVADAARDPAKAPARAAEAPNGRAAQHPDTSFTGGTQMPGMDKTGPMGDGPMTGGGWGLCRPANAAADPPAVAGWGRRREPGGPFGGGFGRRRGRCRARWRATAYEAGRPPEPVAEIDRLRVEAESLTNMLDRLNRRIEALRAVKSEQR